jgi:CheY-like chemotaxis protein
MKRKELVFIVEDSPVQQKMLQVHFEETLGSYAVKTFTDPDELFSHLDEKPFAVVLDHFFENKRNKTGLHYLKELRKNFPSIPVIYYTTLNDSEIKKQVLALGAEDYIIKDSAVFVRLRTALDLLHEKISKQKGFFQRLFGK